MEYLNLGEGNDTQKKSNNKKAIIWGVIVGVAFFIIVFSVIIGSANINEQLKENKLTVTNDSMMVEYSEYLGYSAVVKGVVENVSNKNFSYASVEFSIYDAEGNNLGTAIANINNLSKGDTWRFEAHLLSFPSTKPTRYKLVEITAW